MSEPLIQVEGDGTFLPGERVRGELSGGSAAGEIRLFWITKGRGTQEVGVEDQEAVGAAGYFELSLPPAPYTTSGTLVSIEWGLEWLDASGEVLSACEIIVSPTRQVIQLERVEPEVGTKRRFFRFAGSS
ncbi:MAG: hypothetical protein P1U68_02630 [Verrucomicrobiales bacterium]|nr:hypothetical protein [Verrucomicrobiales bacterium]